MWYKGLYDPAIQKDMYRIAEELFRVLLHENPRALINLVERRLGSVDAIIPYIEKYVGKFYGYYLNPTVATIINYLRQIASKYHPI